MSAEQDGVGQDGPRAGTPGAERDRVAALGHPEDGLRQAGDRDPYEIDVGGARATIDYEPADSTTAMFGGNSKWRGPAWFPRPDGRRPCFGGTRMLQEDPAWPGNLIFSEYFYGDNGAAIGAAHQTGWTALIADVIRRHGDVQTVGDILRLCGRQAQR
ncbi:MAG: hypothetical protein ACR2MP_20665 [Streptosporangiaceae bacterium]